MTRRFLDMWRNEASAVIALAFLLNSIGFASWFARIPTVKDRLELSEAALGVALLGLPLGAFLALVPVSWLIARFGAGMTTLAVGTAYLLTMAAPGVAWDGASLFFALAILGFFGGAMDVAMNTEAAAIEVRTGRRIMSMLHGMWSLGGFLGAALGSLAAGLGLDPGLHLAGVGLLSTLILLARLPAYRRLPRARGGGPVFAVPSRALLLLATMAFLSFMGEGAAGDWSAVYLRQELGSSAAVAAVGFAAFAIGMTVIRFYGDPIAERLGDTAVLVGGAGLAAAGMVIGLLAAHPVAGIAGFTLLGAGYAVVVPTVFRAAAATPGLSPGSSMAAVAGIAYLGGFFGPPAIGLVAEATGLGTALLLVPLGGAVIVILALVRAARGARDKRRSPDEASA